MLGSEVNARENSTVLYIEACWVSSAAILAKETLRTDTAWDF